MNAQATLTHRTTPASTQKSKAKDTSVIPPSNLAQLRHAADQSPSVHSLHQLQQDASKYSDVAIQRIVTQNPVPWGPDRDKWLSSEIFGQLYDSEEEAQAAEDRVLAEREAQNQEAWNDAADQIAWQIEGSARRHYDDGWGALYGIQSDNALIDRISQCDDYPIGGGEHRIDLEKHGHPQEHVMRPCTIVSDVETQTLTVGPITQDVAVYHVFHCGPSDL